MTTFEDENLALQLAHHLDVERITSQAHPEPEINIAAELDRLWVRSSLPDLTEQPVYSSQDHNPQHSVTEKQALSWRERIRNIRRPHKAAHFAGSIAVDMSAESDLPKHRLAKERFTSRNRLLRPVAVVGLALLSFGATMVAGEQSTSRTAAMPSPAVIHPTEVLGKTIIAKPAEPVPLPASFTKPITPGETATPTNVITILVPAHSSVWRGVSSALEARGIDNSNAVVSGYVNTLEKQLGPLDVVQPGDEFTIIAPSA